MVFQEALLFPHLSVRANLRYGVRGREPALFARVVDALGVGELLERRPGALSGGERQRVALGRALLARPRLLLLDEPLASLDGARRAQVLSLLADLARELAMAMVYVSHAPDEIAQLARGVVTLDAGRLAAATGDVESARPAPRRRRLGVSRRGRPAASPVWRRSRRSR
jgi:molybdate transport system ATP-binding protein